MNFLGKMLSGAAKSLATSELKGVAKQLINKFKSRSQADIDSEISSKLGYNTQYYVLSKDQRVIYKPSAVFFNEWLVNSPLTAGKLSRDEEQGEVYYDGKPITNATKLDLINKFTKLTNIKNAGITSHLEGALKLLDTTDYTSIKFQDHFKGWSPSQTSVIDGWLQNCFKLDNQYYSTLFRKWIIGTAKRITAPGTMFDGCLTLKGPGMIGKTSFFRNLLPPPFEQRTNEIYCNPKNPQKFVENILGKSVCCFDELQILDYARSVEIFKQILTSQNIDVRLVYRRDPVRFALRAGFCATTNKDKFISDPFLSRRLWVINLEQENKLNFDYLFANREALWKEALYLVSQGESHFLSAEEHKCVENHNQRYLLG